MKDLSIICGVIGSALSMATLTFIDEIQKIHRSQRILAENEELLAEIKKHLHVDNNGNKKEG